MSEEMKIGATGTEAKVCADIASRQSVGLKKYGVRVEDNPLSKLEWLTHAYQESLDLPIYLRRAIDEEEARIQDIKNGVPRHPTIIPGDWILPHIIHSGYAMTNREEEIAREFFLRGRESNLS